MMGKSNISYKAQENCRKLDSFGKKDIKADEAVVE
jgi:hypothetical protein